tara:strand:+ start:1874 stop:2254 length:381 start_codon:yes stop_codon:yes gene_type:complete
MNWFKKYWTYPAIILLMVVCSQTLSKAQGFVEQFKIDPSLFDGYIQQSIPCGPTKKIFEHLKNVYGEKIKSVKHLEKADVFITLFEDEKIKSWTILISQANVGSCVIAHDENFSLNKRGKIVYRSR